MSIHEDVLSSMKEMASAFAKAGVHLQLPPPSGTLLGTTYTAIEQGTSLSARFGFNDAFQNPVGMFQGGLIGAAFDEVFGPLTYMAAERPTVTLEMSVSYVRPFTAKDKAITIRADVVSKTKSILLLRAEAHTEEGKLIATATTHCIILNDKQLQRVG